jgi:AraC-like DNA-binding protein
MIAVDTEVPALGLSRFVEGVQVVEAVPGVPLELQRLPDGRTTLVLRVMDGGDCADVTVCGPRTRAVFKVAHGLTRAVIVQLKPGWAMPLFGVAATALTDEYVALEELWGSDAVELAQARSLPSLLERFSFAVAARAHRLLDPASAHLARRAVRLLQRGDEPVHSVAERLGVTARHLRRAFSENIGIGPKEFARTVRLHRAVAMSAASTDWAIIAAAAGYYDQAHLIADFRKLVGRTPGDFSSVSAAPLQCVPR